MSSGLFLVCQRHKMIKDKHVFYLIEGNFYGGNKLNFYWVNLFKTCQNIQRKSCLIFFSCLTGILQW